MEVIVTHENADCDAVASLLAAAKLHPSAVALLPRRVNRNIADFLTLYGATLPFTRADDLPREPIQRLIVVDTQSVPTLAGMNEATELRLIDHHRPKKPLPSRAVSVTANIREMGATATLLVSELMHARRALNSIEATLLLLGIYEDTGALTYKSTQLADFQAATWLFEQGAQLEVVQEFLHHPLTPQQRALYQALLEAARSDVFAGYTVIISSAYSGAYVEEISTLAHYLRDVLDGDAQIVLVQMEDAVQVVARSLTDAVDVGALAIVLGGGGHARAAAALVREATLTQVEARVRAWLAAHVRPLVTAGQIMSRSVRTLTINMTIGEAAQIVQRYGHEGFPVVDEQGVVVGLLTRREVDRAVHHQLAHSPISLYMHKGDFLVAPAEGIERVRSIMIERGIGQVPVVEDGRLLGIVTRTDLLKLWGKPPAQAQGINVAERLQTTLPADVLILLQAAGSVAQKHFRSLFAVGGFVRDLLLGQPNFDIDLVFEGDAIKLAKAMEKRFGGRLHIHERFGTAKWLLADTPFSSLSSLDFISARREFYTHPTALPEVEHSSIQQDLYRRDFTLNTLAIRLDESNFGELLDFFGGQDDLRAGVIRVLHNLSLVEDPTRILRAVRYEQRLGFHIEARTAELIADARELLARVSGERITNELLLIGAEREPEKAFCRLHELGVLQAIHLDLHCDAEILVRCERLRVRGQEDGGQLNLQPTSSQSPSAFEPLAYLAALTCALPAESVTALAHRLMLSQLQTQFLAQVNRLWASQWALNEALLRPSQVAGLLRPFSDDVLRVGIALIENSVITGHLTQYLAHWRDVKPMLNGDDLRALGIPRGPIYRDILAALRDARLDERIRTREEEEQIAVKWGRRG